MTRQLNDQISLAKAFLVIAKESDNLQIAGELSVQIKNSQVLVALITPITTTESAIHDMALLLFQAQQLHYDSVTMIIGIFVKINCVSFFFISLLFSFGSRKYSIAPLDLKD